LEKSPQKAPQAAFASDQKLTRAGLIFKPVLVYRGPSRSQFTQAKALTRFDSVVF
jgi:hypothetical protein